MIKLNYKLKESKKPKSQPKVNRVVRQGQNESFWQYLWFKLLAIICLIFPNYSACQSYSNTLGR